MKRITVLSLVLCATVVLKAAPIGVPSPLNSPLFVSLFTSPVVTFGNRTVDFSSNMGQQFINFEAKEVDVSNLYGSSAYRITLGVRARDGLATLGGSLPQSPDSAFGNALPNFALGTTDLILFDAIISGSGTTFSFARTDLNGVTGTVTLQTPIPEPGTLLATGIVLIGLCSAVAVRRRKRYPTARL